ncbi:glycosyltransferase family 2 protein [Deferrisoma sp.]
MRVSVVVPVRNGGEAFRGCLESLVACRPPPDEIVVVADGDSDGSWRLAEALGARVVRLPVPRGPAAARNAGAKVAQGDVLFFVDADVAVHPDAVGRVLALFEEAPSDLAACFGLYDDEPAEPNFLSQYKNLQHHWVHRTGNPEASTFWSGCGAVRRSAFEAVGGFDEGYRRPSIEDIELGYRLREAGYRVRLDKGLLAKHLKRWDIRSHLKAEIFGRALPWTDLILRRGRFVNDLNLEWSERASAAAVWGAAAGVILGLSGQPAAWAGAGASVGAVLVLNRDFYAFLLRRRGPRFLAKALAWHWLYYLYASLAFGVGTLRHLAWGRTRPPSGAVPDGS